MQGTSSRRPARIAVLLALGVGLAPIVRSQERAPRKVFTEARAGRVTGRRLPVDPGARRSRTVRLELPRRGATADALPLLELDLFDGASYDAAIDRVEVDAQGRETWIGRIAGRTDSSVILTVQDGVAAGSIVVGDESYKLRYAGDGLHDLVEVALEDYPVEDDPIPISFNESTARDAAATASDDGTRFDVLVLYTPAARTAAGGKAGIEALIQLGATEANLSYQNSGIIPRLTVVQMIEVGYSESGDIGVDLERLHDPSDGYLDEAHGLRDLYGADFVTLVVEDSCGVGYLMCGNDPSFESWAFNVTGRVCISPNLTFAHELGHNMGSNHAPDDPVGCGATSVSFGYKDRTRNFRTVMAYAPGARVLHFSNPAVSYNGFPTGTATQSNAASINAVRSTLANFRQAVGSPQLSSPLPGSTLGGATETFRWTANGAAVDAWWLYVGSTPGARDLYDSGNLGASTSTTVSGLPMDGRDLHVTLWYQGGLWRSKSYRFTAATGAGSAPSMASPSPGSTLTDSSQTFSWSANGAGVTSWWLYVGTSPGGRELHDSGNLGASLSRTVNGLPTDGSALHVRLWYWLGGIWQFQDFQYTAATATVGLPEMTTPTPGSTLGGSSVSFSWTANGSAVSQWWLYVGTALGAHDLHDSGNLGASLSRTVNGLPTNGATVHVRLWFYLAGRWQFEDYAYTAVNTSPLVTSPAPGTTLGGSSQSFSWSANGTAVTEWWLYIGSTPGASDVLDSGSLGSATSATVSGLPTDGRALHLRLWYRVGGLWRYSDFQYTAAP